MEKRELSYTVGGNVNWYSHYAEQCGDLFLKNGNKTSIGPSNPTPGHISGGKTERMQALQCSLQYCLQQPKHESYLMSINRGMNKEDVVHTYNGILLSH